MDITLLFSFSTLTEFLLLFYRIIVQFQALDIAYAFNQILVCCFIYNYFYTVSHDPSRIIV